VLFLFYSFLFSTKTNKEPLFTYTHFVIIYSVAKGSRVRVNFGQEPFKFNLMAAATMDETQREKRRQETENRRKTALEAEKVLY
jgi:hypothetical protein